MRLISENNGDVWPLSARHFIIRLVGFSAARRQENRILVPFKITRLVSINGAVGEFEAGPSLHYDCHN